jgi:hypothetical protein
MTFRLKWLHYQLNRCDRVSNARHRCELCKVELIAHAKWCGVCAGRKRRT